MSTVASLVGSTVGAAGAVVVWGSTSPSWWSLSCSILFVAGASSAAVWVADGIGAGWCRGTGCISSRRFVLAVASAVLGSSVGRGCTRVNGVLVLDDRPNISPLKILAVWISLGIGARL